MKNKKMICTLIIIFACGAALAASVFLVIGERENLQLKNKLKSNTIKADFTNLNSKIELASADFDNMDIEHEQLIDLRDEMNDCLNALIEVEKTIYIIEQLENDKDMDAGTDMNIKMICDVDFVNYCNGLMEEICNDFDTDACNGEMDFESYMGKFEEISAIIKYYMVLIDEGYGAGEYDNIRQTIFSISDYNKENYLNIPQDQRMINNLDGQ